MNTASLSKLITPRQGLLLFLLGLTSISPFVFSNAIPYYPGKILFLATISLMAVILLLKINISIGDKKVVCILFAQVIFSPIYSLVHTDINYLVIATHALAFLPVYIFIVNFIGMRLVAVSLIKVFVFMGCLAIIAVILALLGILEPFSEFFNPDGRVSYNYLITFSNAVFDFGGFSVVRPAAFFDEPGKFALYITYMLVINKLLNWSKKAEWLLIVAGLFTMSLAFFISFIIYLIFFYSDRKNFIKLIAVALVLSGFGFYLNSIKGESEVASALYRYTIWRLEPSEEHDKILKGDTRSNLIADAAKIFSENIIVGYGRSQAMKDYKDLSANFMVPLAVDGVVGVFFVYLLVIYMLIIAFKPLRLSGIHFDFTAIKVVTIVCMQYLQRPSISSVLDYLLIAMIIYLIKIHSKQLVLNKSIGSKKYFATYYSKPNDAFT